MNNTFSRSQTGEKKLRMFESVVRCLGKEQRIHGLPRIIGSCLGLFLYIYIGFFAINTDPAGNWSVMTLFELPCLIVLLVWVLSGYLIGHMIEKKRFILAGAIFGLVFGISQVWLVQVPPFDLMGPIYSLIITGNLDMNFSTSSHGGMVLFFWGPIIWISIGVGVGFLFSKIVKNSEQVSIE